MSKALTEAARKGNLEEINKLLRDATININDIDEQGDTALHMAALYARPHAVEALIKLNADVNAIDKSGLTALHIAAQMGHSHSSTVEVLIKLNADINAVNKDGLTALHMAIQFFSTPTTIEALIKHTADVNVVDINNNTALHFAARKGCTYAVEALIKRNANINAVNKYGDTALHYAILYALKNQNGIDIIKNLLRFGAFIDVIITNYPQKDNILKFITPYTNAIEQLFAAASNPKTPEIDLSNIFSTLGEGLNGRLQREENTALHIALERNQELALRLIAQNIPVNVLNKNKLSAIDILNSQQKTPVIKLCYALIETNLLKNLVEQQKSTFGNMTIATRTSHSVSQKNSKSAMDAPLMYSSTATAAAETIASASSNTALAITHSPSEFELKMQNILKWMDVSGTKGLDIDGDHFNQQVNQELDATTQMLYVSTKQSISFEIGALIFKNPTLFPNSIDTAEYLLESITEKHPVFQESNALLFNIVNSKAIGIKNTSIDNSMTLRKIKYLLAAGDKSEHHGIAGHLMADALNLGLNNKAFNGITTANWVSMYRLFIYTLKEKQEAQDEINRLKLLLNQKKLNDKTALSDKINADVDTASTATHYGEKRKKQEITQSSSITTALNTAATSMMFSTTTSSDSKAQGSPPHGKKLKS